MDAETIKKIFAGLDEPTRNILVHKLKPQLSKALHGLNENLRTMQTPLASLCPSVDNILAAFRVCPIGSARVVIIAQDPYIGAGEAHGLCFSVPRGVTIPPSLKNIIACLRHTNLMQGEPTDGDLTSWAKQGVLLLNAALTTRLGKSNEHASIWAPYTDAIVSYLSNEHLRCIFMLFGGFARGKAQLIDAKRHLVLEWGHPSPLNRDNKGNGPKHFRNCDAFTLANRDLVGRGLLPIDWNLSACAHTAIVHLNPVTPETKNPVTDVAQPPLPYPIARVVVGAGAAIDTSKICSADDNDPCPLTATTLWIFTDGASRANGRINCTATWGFYITDGTSVVSACGMVKPVDIPEKVYKSSNNRGELSAVLFALQTVVMNKASFFFNNVMVVSDSEYAIDCVDKHLTAWESKLTTKQIDAKLNIDLIRAANIARASIAVPCKFRHVNSHKIAPEDIESEAWFIWRGNYIADELCEVAFSAQ